MICAPLSDVQRHLKGLFHNWHIYFPKLCVRGHNGFRVGQFKVACKARQGVKQIYSTQKLFNFNQGFNKGKIFVVRICLFNTIIVYKYDGYTRMNV